MAEYIDKNDVDFYCSYQGDCMGSSSDCEKCWDYVVARQDFMRVPTSDVVEREKIDEALEITYKVREMVLHSNRTYEVNDVLDIIDEISACFERHIGE